MKSKTKFLPSLMTCKALLVVSACIWLGSCCEDLVDPPRPLPPPSDLNFTGRYCMDDDACVPERSYEIEIVQITNSEYEIKNFLNRPEIKVRAQLGKSQLFIPKQRISCLGASCDLSGSAKRINGALHLYYAMTAPLPDFDTDRALFCNRNRAVISMKPQPQSVF